MLQTRFDSHAAWTEPITRKCRYLFQIPFLEGMWKSDHNT